MKVNTNGSIHHEVSVDVNDVLKALAWRLRFADSYGRSYDHTAHNGVDGIYSIEDVSHHGSPIWEYTLITDKESDIKAFDCINYLIGYLKPEERADD